MNTTDPYIVTYTGKKVCPVRPDIEQICIEDIAHSLSMKCRWNGHTTRFYSVAQHSVIVSQLCSHLLAGLLHDAAEAYLSDVATTVKHLFPTMRYAEEIVQEVVYERFGVEMTQQEEEILKAADRAVLRLEWEELMNDPEGHGIAVEMEGVPRVYCQLADCWSPERAESEFLDRFADITEMEDYR